MPRATKDRKRTFSRRNARPTRNHILNNTAAKTTDEEGLTHIDDFFSRYPEFQYNPSAPVMSQFFAMSDQFDWKKKKRDSAHQMLKIAMVNQFNSMYGTDVDSLESWRNICQILNISPVPNELKACRNAVKSVYVNIVDLVDIHSGISVETFETERDLAQYTKKTGKVFPRDSARAGGVLKFLLRRIWSPRTRSEQKKPEDG